ncbi:YggT family protein [Cohnella sp. CIP 111063]|uniref:YggT family protein n=1 Tax=unclassified Cohnella TaxID=2636738 RepID=UPI000B8C0B63|nr:MULTISPECIES: YggT family protein [unclassified Cohnella]OXS62426.1 YggT family protein [Cohnella sp. CIP 111063]PRX74664.1 YggT family protein [Cohnella sp. SGD-V74]
MEQLETYIGIVYRIYSYMIIIYVLMSWLPAVKESFVGELLGKLVEPYLRPFRKLIPPIGGMLDISPIIAYFALGFVAQGLIAVLRFLFG